MGNKLPHQKRAARLTAQVGKLNADQRAALYDRWLDYFDYRDQAGNGPVDVYDPEWEPCDIVYKLLEAWPTDKLNQFLVDEGLEDNHGTNP